MRSLLLLVLAAGVLAAISLPAGAAIVCPVGPGSGCPSPGPCPQAQGAVCPPPGPCPLAQGATCPPPCPLVRGERSAAPAVACPAPAPCSLNPAPTCPVPAGADTHPRVRPHRGRPGATFHVLLTARITLGPQGSLTRNYRVIATGRAGRDCSASAQATLSSGAAGQVLRADLVPTRRWCRGRYRGAVLLEGGPYCPPGPAGVPVACPAFALAPTAAGRFTFRVR